jgi:hypothetical protein
MGPRPRRATAAVSSKPDLKQIRSRSSSTKRKVSSPEEHNNQDKKYKQIQNCQSVENQNKTFTKVANIENETKQKSTKMTENIENNQILDNTVSEFSSTSFNNESHNPVSQMAMFPQQIYSMGPPMIPHLQNPLLMSSPICSSTNSSPHSTNISDQDVEKIASVLKEALKDEIQTLVNIQVANATSEMKSEINILKKEIEILKSKTLDLNTRQEEAEQYSRKNNVRIGNYTEKQSENVTDIVIDIASKIGSNISKSDIDNCHRLGKKKSDSQKTRDIIVKFTSYRAKSEFIKGRKKLKEKHENIFINEDLTKYRSDIAYEARLLKKDTHSSIISTWTFNGCIYVQTKNDEVQKITKKEDLIMFS